MPFVDHIVLALALASPIPPGASGICFAPPIEAPITDPFRMPACTYCPGNRGIEYGPTAGSPVRALTAGMVQFVGLVAGTRWLVVLHDDGVHASYGRMATISVNRGDSVRAGQILGTSTDRFYVGLRDGDRPIDPTPLIGRWSHRRRLVPTDGAPARSAGSPRLVCGIGGGGR